MLARNMSFEAGAGVGAGAGAGPKNGGGRQVVRAEECGCTSGCHAKISCESRSFLPPSQPACLSSSLPGLEAARTARGRKDTRLFLLRHAKCKRRSLYGCAVPLRSSYERATSTCTPFGETTTSSPGRIRSRHRLTHRGDQSFKCSDRRRRWGHGAHPRARTHTPTTHMHVHTPNLQLLHT